MLNAADIFFTLLHLAIIGFNLTGWIWPTTRKWHLGCVLLTAGSWLVLGIWLGLGYCPITDWQWDVKRKLGEANLPNSFITYYAEKIAGRDINDAFIDTMTAIVFVLAAMLSLYFNFFHKNRNKQAV